MRLLLDTHVFLWYITSDAKLPATFREAIQDPVNEVYLSVASIWEAVIKSQLGKLPLPEPADEYLPKQRDAHGIASLPIDEGAMPHLAGLPLLHRRQVGPHHLFPHRVAGGMGLQNGRSFRVARMLSCDF
jgi:PIN domain nuclease of toxin-antitoxin system